MRKLTDKEQQNTKAYLPTIKYDEHKAAFFRLLCALFLFY